MSKRRKVVAILVLALASVGVIAVATIGSVTSGIRESQTPAVVRAESPYKILEAETGPNPSREDVEQVLAESAQSAALYWMEPAEHFSMLSLRAETQGNYGVVTGRIKNIGTRTCGELHLDFDVLDRRGQKVGFAKVSRHEALFPGEVWSFTAKAGVYRGEGVTVRLDPVTGIRAFP